MVLGDQSLNRDPGLSSNQRARILLLSLRNLKKHVSRALVYEFEDVIQDVDDVDLLAPVCREDRDCLAQRVIARVRGRLCSAIGNGQFLVRRPAAISVQREYDLFVFLCNQVEDLVFLRSLRGWQRMCRNAVCVVHEVWDKDVDRLLIHADVLRHFDRIFVATHHVVGTLSERLGQPCGCLPAGVDALRFCPYPVPPDRSIDVYNMGRRSAVLHSELLRSAREGRLLYLYDTSSNFNVIDYREHRDLLASIVKRSRYFIVNRAGSNGDGLAGGKEVCGARYWEGAAGGAVLLGYLPQADYYRRCFHWPGAVLEVPDDGEGIRGIIEDLDRQPEMLARIRNENVVHSLLEHDWGYRWKMILQSVGMTERPGNLLRASQLSTLAGIAEAEPALQRFKSSQLRAV